MTIRMLTAGVVCGALMLPLAAYAQNGATGGAVAGAIGGAVVAGPVGAVVGGIGGAVVGGLSENVQPRFRTYVVEQKRPSYAYGSEVIVGAELPEAGLVYYDVPAEYNVPQYRYTVVNNRTVLVDPRTRRIVQVVN